MSLIQILGLAVALYIWSAFCLYLIARKIDMWGAWFAWVPVLNLILICRAADKPDWWVFLFLVPLVNIVIYVDIWMTIAEECNRPPWVGVFMIIPGVNFIVLGILAFAQAL